MGKYIYKIKKWDEQAHMEETHISVIKVENDTSLQTYGHRLTL